MISVQPLFLIGPSLVKSCFLPGLKTSSSTLLDISSESSRRRSTAEWEEDKAFIANRYYSLHVCLINLGNGEKEGSKGLSNTKVLCGEHMCKLY